MNENFVTDESQCTELERAINELLKRESPTEDTTTSEPPENAGDELQGIFGAQS